MRHNPEKRQAETWHLPCAGGEILRLASLAQDDSAVDGQLMTPSVMALAGDAPCHLPQRGRHFCSLPEGGYVGTFSAARGPHPAAARPPSPCAGKAMTPHPSCGGRDTPHDTFSSKREASVARYEPTLNRVLCTRPRTSRICASLRSCSI